MPSVRILAITLLPLVSGAVHGAGTCKGEDPCKACKDCSACAYCSPKNPTHGSCGVMRDQDGAQQRARDAKRAKR